MLWDGCEANAFSGRPVRISHTRTPSNLLHELIIHHTSTFGQRVRAQETGPSIHEIGALRVSGYHAATPTETSP